MLPAPALPSPAALHSLLLPLLQHRRQPPQQQPRQPLLPHPQHRKGPEEQSTLPWWKLPSEACHSPCRTFRQLRGRAVPYERQGRPQLGPCPWYCSAGKGRPLGRRYGSREPALVCVAQLRQGPGGVGNVLGLEASKGPPSAFAC